MQLKIYVWDSLRSLWMQPLRSILSIALMGVGITALSTLFNLKEFASYAIQQNLSALGLPCFVSWVVQTHDPSLRWANIQPLLTMHHDLVIVPYTLQSKIVKMREIEFKATLVGLEESSIQMAQWQLNRGVNRFDPNHPLTCIIGASLAEKYQLVVGDRIWIGDQVFTLIGILKPQIHHPILEFQLNEAIFVHFLELVELSQPVENFLVLYKNNLDSSKQLFQFFIQKLYGPYPIYFRDESFYKDHIYQSFNSYAVLLTWIGQLALWCAVLGIMVQQWLAFLERRGECGMRFSLGAHRKDIFILFLCESCVLGTLSGGVGILGAYILTKWVVVKLQWSVIWCFSPFVKGFFISIVTSSLSGIIPATIAANSQPTKLLVYH